MANTVVVIASGAVGFIDWLDAVAIVGFGLIFIAAEICRRADKRVVAALGIASRVRFFLRYFQALLSPFSDGRLSICGLEHQEDVSTTMIYTHVLNKPGIGVKSPLD